MLSALEEIGFVDWAGLDPDVRLVDCLEPCIKLPPDHEVIGLTIIRDGLILTATENGYGKRTAVEDFPIQGRGGQGVIAIQTSGRNGRTVGAAQVREDDEITS